MSIKLDNVSYTYMQGTPYQKTAIREITLEIQQREFVGVIGHTGSGKSTLIQHLNGLLQPTLGEVLVDGVNLHTKSAESKSARRKVGMVFQYPEQQLFEETVFDDIAFGPRNLKLDADTVEARVRRAMDFVGLDFDAFSRRSPFRLSGGQMRRVAIAGVIALEPTYLVLDEPSAGLDPRGRDEIFGQILNLYHTSNITVILVSHNMEDIARMANRLLVMHDGIISLDGRPETIFGGSIDRLRAAGVDVPSVTTLLRKLKTAGLPVLGEALTPELATEEILAAMGGKYSA
ncbi:energy-coupling factor transporter ATPase [Anaerosporomusa subterranea]|uniref:Energy-coupling factor transporter ATP-binding protein EcfA2 n=1 Tax=Anaerosporomusa subterranea TaxID=1794912 RepID=A0A154BUX9_ANASB|nr:energy-coupling factor transporter ATPase [Anaerosporomusa subterranea]KYZ77732.1 energy-coupling factor transporter ATPase [Anaerosporomusa subterranea]